MRRVGAVLLAAGGSSRMGVAKQLLPYRGRSLLRHAAETAVASPCRPVVVVLGAGADRAEEELAGLPVAVVRNPSWSGGIGTSIRAGIAALCDAEAALILLGDQPLVGPEALLALLERFGEGGSDLVASEYAGTLGVPALFARVWFPRLLGLADDEGAKRVILAAGAAVARVPCPAGALDVDTPGDYARAVGEIRPGP
jgi:molybdenum cofactor cytidylyltransferase